MTVQALVALVFAVWKVLGATGPDERPIALAIAQAVASEKAPATGESHAVDAALEAYYAWKESRLNEHPHPESWDAIAGLSCGAWQLRCYLVTGVPLETQARTWLDSLHRAGLARGVDSSPTRAAHRLEKTREALAEALR